MQIILKLVKLQNIKLIFKKPVIFEHHIKRMKTRNHVTILIDAEKAPDKMLHSRTIKTVDEPGMEADPVSGAKAGRPSPRPAPRDAARERRAAVPLRSGSTPPSAPPPNTDGTLQPERAHRESEKWTSRFGGKKKERQRGIRKEPSPKSQESP